MNKAAGALELPIISDPFEALLRLYRGLRSLWDFLDEGQQEIRRYNNGKLVCVEKCGACCQTPMVSKVEVSYMLGCLYSREPIREAALTWVATPDARLKAQGIPYGQALSGEHLATLQADSLALLRSPCPLLGPELRCQVYDVRPLACRAYGVTSVAAEWCPRPLTPYETPSGRMLIGKDTPLGMKIAGLTVALWQSMRYMQRTELGVIGLLPMLIAEASALDKVRQLQGQGLIQPAKMGKGRWGIPDLFMQQ